MHATKWVSHIVLLVLFMIFITACENKTQQQAGVSYKTMVDALHEVMQADRTVYSRVVINRLVNKEKVIKASEHWQDDKALPLPAQVFRLGAETANENGANFSFGLLSTWPINTKNAPMTEAEKTGLKFLSDNPGKNYYTEEQLGQKRYFTAIYPDVAVADACVECHNEHKDSPKSNFKIGDVMGGVVIRVPML